MEDQADGANSTGSGGRSGPEDTLPCSDQSADAVRAWCVRLSVGDPVAVRIFDDDGLVRYAVTSVIDVLDGHAVVLEKYGAFDYHGCHAFMPGTFQLVKPTAAVREAAAEARAYRPPECVD